MHATRFLANIYTGINLSITIGVNASKALILEKRSIKWSMGNQTAIKYYALHIWITPWIDSRSLSMQNTLIEQSV